MTQNSTNGRSGFRIQIFRTGTHTCTNGQSITFSAADLAATAAAYSPATYTAPLVLGHPETDAPAYGSVQALSAEGDKLFANVSPTPDLAQKVREGFYLSVSAAFYQPGHAHNPTPGIWALRHVGFLGAHPPAVKGMQRPAFGDAGQAIVFAQPLQWDDAALTGTVSYSEDPQGFHQAATQLVGQALISYGQAAQRLEQCHRLSRQKQAPYSGDSARYEDHRKIVAYMERHPSTTYAQAFNYLLSQGELTGN